ncbi:MAG TPA: phosphoglucosamine mutase [Candidatus Sulfotelmatobacter sp.]|nr:phosphoglucosamine mutase [Candidatus Sulfotelmatobacter sp.]
MTTPLFGTDGIRGLANEEPMTAMTALKVALAAGNHFRTEDRRHVAVIGKDTRLSGYMLEPALAAGLISVGIDVVLVGPLPTPAIAMLTRSMRADLGIMISASHNPYQDNGIKLFGPDGYKLSDAVEAGIAAAVQEDRPPALAAPDALGRARRLDDAQGRYIEFVKNSFPRGLRLDGLKVVIDCAHGAAYKVAPTVLWELGAEVVPIGVQPDGFNINQDSGAVHVDALTKQVVAHGADLGIALDGDADRVIVVDERGVVVDGDQIMGLVASSWANDGRLKGGGLVATVMSNLGLERHLDTLGLKLVRTRVGDRYVVEEMRRSGFNVGGEQSGHIILSDYTTTGDGLIAALQCLAVVIQSERPASAVARVFTPLPQVLKSVRFARNGKAPLDHAAVQATIADAERRLGTHGRLVIRKSGTESVIRVMAEGEDDAMVGSIVDEIAAAITRAVG